MTNQIKQIIIFCARRYNETCDLRPGLARAHLVILNRAYEVQIGTSVVDDLLDFLNAPHAEINVTRACKEVLEHIGAT